MLRMIRNFNDGTPNRDLEPGDILVRDSCSVNLKLRLELVTSENERSTYPLARVMKFLVQVGKNFVWFEGRDVSEVVSEGVSERDGTVHNQTLSVGSMALFATGER